MGSEKKTSAVADATDKAVRMMVGCEKDAVEEAKLEYRMVTIIRTTPQTQVRSVSSDVPIRGEDGLGKEARADPLVIYEFWG